MKKISMKKFSVKKLFWALGFVFTSQAALAATEHYEIDTKHSFANFSIRHVVAKTSGTLTDVSGVIQIDRENLANSSVNAKINLLSINTGLAKRDEHIKKAEYLDAEKFSDITFVSKKVVATSATEGTMTGLFTLHGVTKELTIPFKVLGFGADPWGGQRSGFEAHTVLKASDFGLPWGAKADGPVGNEIEVTLLIEGIKKK
jgi:polyisoprenoid-binding protein YceI